MLEKKEFEIPSEKFKKGATVYTDSDTPVKAAIIYFHGGGLLYGRRKDLPRPHLNTLTQAGYAIIAFDYPLAPAAKLEMICAFRVFRPMPPTSARRNWTDAII